MDSSLRWNDHIFFYLCPFIFILPLSYDAFASTFSASRENLHWGEVDYFVEYIENRFQGEQISILDVGCGNGRFIKTLENSLSPLSSEGEGLGVRLERTTYSYLGIDESAGMIDEAKKLHPWHTFKVLDMTHMEELSDSGTYDVIVFIASFHHLHTPQERKEVLEKAKKLLKKWGILMMTNWNLLGETLFAKYEKSHKWGGDFQVKIGAHERHYHGFTIPELESLFRESGYCVLENRVFEGGRNIISILEKQHPPSIVPHESFQWQ